MDAKKELIERLAAMMPGMATEIAHILEEYRISRENRRRRLLTFWRNIGSAERTGKTGGASREAWTVSWRPKK